MAQQLSVTAQIQARLSARLLVRQRYCYPRRQAALWHFVGAVSFVMERRMLQGIKARAESRHPAPLPA